MEETVQFAALPSDCVKRIISKLDIDTRIKMGLIFKLYIPEEVKEQISSRLQTPEQHHCFALLKLKPYKSTQQNAVYTFMRMFEWNHAIETTYLQFFIFHSKTHLVHAEWEVGHEFFAVMEA